MIVLKVLVVRRTILSSRVGCDRRMGLFGHTQGMSLDWCELIQILWRLKKVSTGYLDLKD